MAIGDDAVAAGIPLVIGATDLVKDGADHHNETRDEIARRTYAILPVSKGGTGSNTPATARSNLGIVAANIPTVSTNVQEDIDYLADTAEKARLGDLDIAVWNRDITWTRREAWIGNNGLVELGYNSSRRDHKQDFADPEWTAAQLRAIPILHYRYIAEVAKAKADPDYHAAVNIGTIAEDLHDLGLWEFVAYEAGEPVGVHYNLIGLAALRLAQLAHDRLDDLEARLAEGTN